MSENLDDSTKSSIENITKLANVEVTLLAELGKTDLALKDAVEFSEGTVITLDKFYNEPVNIYVDDILIAKAQIVAIEKDYGIKIIEIVNNEAIEKVKNDKIS